MKAKDEFMLRALGLAFDRMGSTSPNPAVGAVIVKDGIILSEGGTCPCGSDHAEVSAIKSATGDIKGADMYVTLEPCNHYGKTPPCTEAIIRSGIRTVHVPILDPNPIVAGKGVSRLREAGVNVVMMDGFAAAAADLIRPFRKSILKKTPFVVHKCAMTLDGRTATLSGDSRWISSESSRCIAHRLRARVDAVIVGKNTLHTDNPALTARPDDFGRAARDLLAGRENALEGRDNFFLRALIERQSGPCTQPLRVVSGIPEDIDRGARFFADDRHVIFENAKKIDSLARDPGFVHRTAGLNIVKTRSEDPLDSVREMLAWLSSKGIMFAMLEGGSRLAGSFLDCGEIDQFLYFIAPRIAGAGIPAISGRGCGRMADSLRLEDVTTVRIGDDLLVNGYAERYNFEVK
ncbi:MAG TPA: bifunctional diaminohydroxyphosphoribosylaminopyrimidine deaminase/5-amino-6-(5-phosphoribosylamino)uracil reductase RibD [Spirochaetota bacterium]|nr:bifunctional diaminohydroxyphosphoribosylaminopyrimidine deaminase/5-amino-6-(5-phosphoribosylamino)uracil reductase RibD [Spirochaetota bacterium]